MNYKFAMEAGTIEKKKLRSFFAGYLFGLGFVNFFIFIVTSVNWEVSAPHAPIPTKGLVFPHTVKGAVVYFDSFETRALLFLISLSIPLALLGYILSPKSIRPSAWSPNPLTAASKFGFLAGAACSPIIVYFLGPALVEWSLQIWPLTGS